MAENGCHVGGIARAQRRGPLGHGKLACPPLLLLPVSRPSFLSGFPPSLLSFRRHASPTARHLSQLPWHGACLPKENVGKGFEPLAPTVHLPFACVCAALRLRKSRDLPPNNQIDAPRPHSPPALRLRLRSAVCLNGRVGRQRFHLDPSWGESSARACANLGTLFPVLQKVVLLFLRSRPLEDEIPPSILSPLGLFAVAAAMFLGP